MRTVLQIDWFIDPNPELLPIWLIALGLEAMFVGASWQVLQQMSGYRQSTKLERSIAVFGVGLGYLFLTLSVLRTSYGSYAGYLYLVFRGVEGVAATHIYLKAFNFLRGKGSGGNLKNKAKHLLVVFFVAALGGYLILKGLVERPRFGGIWYDVSLIYTVMVALLSFLAVRWRYRDITADLNSGVILGLAMCIAGAQIFGFSLTGDILLTAAGSVVYSVGFWFSVYLMWGEVLTGSSGGEVNRASSTCPHCQQPLPKGIHNQFCPHCGNSI